MNIYIPLKKTTTMKKTLLFISLPVIMSACGGGGPKEDAERMCTLRSELKAAFDTKNTEAIKSINERGFALEKEIQEKYKDDKEGKQKYEMELMGCSAHYR
jgi:hypothetical protein